MLDVVRAVTVVFAIVSAVRQRFVLGVACAVAIAAPFLLLAVVALIRLMFGGFVEWILARQEV